jgi:hypothetical protein
VLDNLKNGIGKLTFYGSGKSYKGEFLNNVYEGFGSEKCKEYQYHGYFKYGKFDGIGFYQT